MTEDKRCGTCANSGTLSDREPCKTCTRSPGWPAWKPSQGLAPSALTPRAIPATEGNEQEVRAHPLYPLFMAAIKQAMYGKGERHGGARTPFLEQPWVHYVKLHGRGFATGQAAKKLEEAASTRAGEAFETEVLGAMVYLGMSILFERGELKDSDV